MNPCQLFSPWLVLGFLGVARIHPESYLWHSKDTIADLSTILTNYLILNSQQHQLPMI